MKKIGIILFAALIIEGVNVRFGGLALDPGNFSDMPWYLQLTAIEWSLLHDVGLIALALIEGDWSSQKPHPLIPGPIPSHDAAVHQIVHRSHYGAEIVIFLGGYLTTSLLLFAVEFGLGQFMRWRRRRSAESARLAS